MHDRWKPPHLHIKVLQVSCNASNDITAQDIFEIHYKMWMTDLEKQVLLNNQADNLPGRPTRPCETNSNKTLHCALVQLLVACPTVHTSRLDQTRPKPTKREFLWNAFFRLGCGLKAHPTSLAMSLYIFLLKLQVHRCSTFKKYVVRNWKSYIFGKSVHLSPSCQTKSQRLEQLHVGVYFTPLLR